MTQASSSTASTTPNAADTITPPKQPLAGWVEVFRAGTHTDSKGRRCSFTADDLDQMVTNHALGAAPIVLGHPKDNDPAFGWEKAVKREGNKLYAQYTDINPAFAKGVETGAYRNRSLSVYKDPTHGWRIRHHGWLGAVPPAIDGLAPLAFAAPESECFEFSAPGRSLLWGMDSLVNLLRSMRDRFIERDGLEVANATLPQWQIDSISESVTAARAELDAAEEPDADDAVKPLNPVFNAPGDSPMTITPEQLEEAKKAAAEAARADAAAEFAKQSEAKDAELAALQRQRRADQVSAKVDALVKAGRVTPAQRAGLVEFMCGLPEDDASAFSFSQADGAEVKKSPATFMHDFLAALPVQVKLGQAHAEGDTQTVDMQDPAALVQAAQEYTAAQAAKGVVVPLHEAVAHVSRKAD